MLMTDMEKQVCRARHNNRRMLDIIHECAMKNSDLSEEERGKIVEEYRKNLDEFYNREENDIEYLTELAENRGIRKGAISVIAGNIIGLIIGGWAIPFVVDLFHKKE